MTTVFLSGSRNIRRLNDLIRSRLDNIIEHGLSVLIGDANGADKAFQAFFADAHYDKVVVFCAGSVCRNNLGAWPTATIAVNRGLRGRAFYEQKDKAMAAKADYGFVLWDGKSTGSMNNVIELMKARKPTIVYFVPEKKVYCLKQPEELTALLRRSDAANYHEIDELYRHGKLPVTQSSFDFLG